MRMMPVRFLPPLFAAALIAGCGGLQQSPVPQTTLAGQSHARAFRPMDAGGPIFCGSSPANCHDIRLVAPLDVQDQYRFVTVSLSSTMCADAPVHFEGENRFPFEPQTYTASSMGMLPLRVMQMTDPCASASQHGDSLRHPMIAVTAPPTPGPANTNYYVVALIQRTDGTDSVVTLDGPANETGTTLTFSATVRLMLQPGTYAFYLATEQPAGNGDGGEGGDD